jgi:hypothetical protein
MRTLLPSLPSLLVSIAVAALFFLPTSSVEA